MQRWAAPSPLSARPACTVASCAVLPRACWGDEPCRRVHRSRRRRPSGCRSSTGPGRRPPACSAAVVPRIVAGGPGADRAVQVPGRDCSPSPSGTTTSSGNTASRDSLITPFQVAQRERTAWTSSATMPACYRCSDLRIVVAPTVLTSTQGRKRRVASIADPPAVEPLDLHPRRGGAHARLAGHRHPPGLAGHPGAAALSGRHLGHRHRLGQHHRSAVPAPVAAASACPGTWMQQARSPMVAGPSAARVRGPRTRRSMNHAGAGRTNLTPARRQQLPAVRQGGRLARVPRGRRDELGHRLRRDRLPRRLHAGWATGRSATSILAATGGVPVAAPA